MSEDTVLAERLVILERACAALAAVVREEWGDKHPLSYIAETEGGPWITPEQVAALRQIEDDATYPKEPHRDPEQIRGRDDV
jgi:hypothetical protein